MIFRVIVLSLPVVPSFACSVASLGLIPEHYLPADSNLHCHHLAAYWLDVGDPSTHHVGLVGFHEFPSPPTQ